MARPGWSKRIPWPHDAMIGGLGVMLKPGEDGQMVATKSKPLDAAPATFQYETQQPFLERTYVLRDLFDGMGQQLQPAEGHPRRYHYAIDIDTTVNGHAMLGPLFHPESVTESTGSVTQIIVAQHDGEPAVFALVGEQVVRREGDNTWVNSLTLTGGSQTTQAVRFKPAGLDTARVVIVSPLRLPRGSVGKAYSYRLEARGGSAPYYWGIASGSLPAGLTLSTAGLISGTPTTDEDATFQLRALDTNNVLTAVDMALSVETAAEPLAVDTFGPQREALIGESYSITLNARGGTGPYSWALLAGSLPSGLSLDPSTGIISGTPAEQTATPTPELTVQATDAVATTANAEISIRVRRPNDDYLYLASTASNLHMYDGDTWQEATAASGPPEGAAEYIAVLDDELWVMWGNKLAKTEANPLERDNWSGSILLAGSDGTNLATVGQTLYAFKRDGVFTVNQDGSSQNILPQLRDVQIEDNGQQASIWLDSLWAPLGNAFYRITADGTFTPVGTEQLLENASEVKGRIVASVGHNTWHNYELLFNAATGDSYLGKYGAWVEEAGGSDSATPGSRFRAAHHFAIKKWEGKQATCCAIITAADLGESNDRLYVGFSNRSVEWCVLPRYSPNPSTDTLCEFTDERGVLVYPGHHAGFAVDTKNFRGWSVFGPTLSNLLFARISYRLEPTSSFTTLSDADLDPVDFTADGQRYDVPGATLVGKTVEFRLELQRSEAASINTTPVVDGVAIHEQLRPAFVLEWTMNVETSAATARHDGTAERRSPDQIRDALRVALAASTPTTVILPDGSSEEMGYIDYREELKSYSHRWGLAFDIAVKAMQYRTLSNVAQVYGLSYATLEQYNYTQLEGIL